MDSRAIYEHTEMMRKCTSTLIELEAMKAANKEREIQDLAPAYGEDAIMALINPLYEQI